MVFQGLARFHVAEKLSKGGCLFSDGEDRIQCVPIRWLFGNVPKMAATCTLQLKKSLAVHAWRISGDKDLPSRLFGR